MNSFNSSKNELIQNNIDIKNSLEIKLTKYTELYIKTKKEFDINEYK